MPPQLYVNPACSKCRTAVSILAEHEVQADEVRYLDEPPTVADLRRLMTRLGIDDARLMMRTGEPVYTELALDEQAGDALLDAIPSCWSGPSSSSQSARSSHARPKGSSSSSDLLRYTRSPAASSTA